MRLLLATVSSRLSALRSLAAALWWRGVISRRCRALPIHPARAHIHIPRTAGEQASDILARFAGSWLFVFLHVVWFTLWLVLRLDINLLTLIVSLEAIFLATFVLMTQNRQASKDQVRDDLEASEVGQLFIINQRQLEILELLHVARAGAGEIPVERPSSAPVSLETSGNLSSSH